VLPKALSQPVFETIQTPPTARRPNRHPAARRQIALHRVPAAPQLADCDEVARAFRDDVAQDYEMMSPGFGASLACILFALGRCRSSVLDNV
jgi:hypothetical protein